MKQIITRIENKGVAALGCYVLPFLTILLFTLSGYLGVGVFVFLTLIVWFSDRDSRIRFHFTQAVMLLIVTALAMGLAYWVMFGSKIDRFALSDGIEGLVTIGMMMVVWGLIILVFGIVYLYTAVKAAAGHDVRVFGIAKLAVWIYRDLPDEVKKFSQEVLDTRAQINKGEYRLQDHIVKLIAIVASISFISFLAINVPGFLWPLPNPDPPLGIRAQAIGAAETFVGFPWDIDAGKVKALANEQGWKTGERVSSMTGLGCQAKLEGYPAVLQFFFINDQAYTQHFSQGYITMRAKDCPVELVYHRFLEILTEQYGPAGDIGYPPWRSKNTQPYGQGAGLQWEIRNGKGQKVTIYLALEFEQSKTAPSSYSPAILHVRYKNETLYEKGLQGNP
ncbi:MAG: hypothetical protein H6Q65_953 [Firmicutes bacterium]|nr:hypothetical protein [Bacillota bacterium]